MKWDAFKITKIIKSNDFERVNFQQYRAIVSVMEDEYDAFPSFA